jgi:hypothetical protein
VNQPISLIVWRDSVCAGDDCDAPHERAFSIPGASTLGQAAAQLLGSSYLASISGGKATWFYLAWTKELQNLQQPVGEFISKVLPQLVGELAGSNLPQPVAEIPWGHNLVLLAKLKTPLIRLWYAHKVIEHGWSRAVLTHRNTTA